MSDLEKDNSTISVIKSFNSSFESGNLIDTFSQIGETALDFALEMGDAASVLKDIPVLGLIISGTRTVSNIKAYVLAKKVYMFFYCIKDIPIEKRQQFAEEYCKENREDTAEALLNILDKLNNQNYVPIICQLMRAKMEGKISIAEFNRTILALERTSYTDIFQLSKFSNDYYEEGLAEAFESAGLVYQSVIDGGAFADPDNGTKMRLSPTGRILLEYGLNTSAVLHTPRSTEVKGILHWEPIVKDGVLSFQEKKT